MNVPIHRIRKDFDRIALLSENYDGTGDLYHNYLLPYLPPHCVNTLEVGCGTGAFTRRLATRSQNVVAIDLSPQMIRLAQQQSADYPNIEYVLGDVMRVSLPAESYDCIISLATMHHLPLEQTLSKMKAALKPNGRLIIHDLIADDGLIDKIMSALAYPISGARRFWKSGRLRVPKEVRKAWAEHGKDEIYFTLNEVREMCRRYLPKAEIHRHLLWRYTVVWCKRGAA